MCSFVQAFDCSSVELVDDSVSNWEPVQLSEERGDMFFSFLGVRTSRQSGSRVLCALQFGHGSRWKTSETGITIVKTRQNSGRNKFSCCISGEVVYDRGFATELKVSKCVR